MKDKIVFFGRNNAFPVTTRCFERLIYYKNNNCELFDISAVVVSDDNHEANYTLEELARQHRIPVLVAKDNKVNDPEFIERYSSLNPTIAMIVQFPELFKNSMITVPSRACFNLHMGWPLRGGSIDARAIWEQMESYNPIIHHVTTGIDSGNIIGMEGFTLTDDETGYTVAHKGVNAAVNAFEKHFLPIIGQENMPDGKKQILSQTSYANKGLPLGGKIDWDMSVEEVHRLIRACYHPRQQGAYTEISGQKIYLLPGRIHYANQKPAGRLFATRTLPYDAQYFHMGDKVAKDIRTLF